MSFDNVRHKKGTRIKTHGGAMGTVVGYGVISPTAFPIDTGMVKEYSCHLVWLDNPAEDESNNGYVVVAITSENFEVVA